MDLPAKDKHPLAHAAWIKDAMEATKRAAEHAKSYPELDCREWEVPRDERAIAFFEKNSTHGGSLQDAIVNAMRWHIPPDQMRDVEIAVQVRDLELQIDNLKSSLECSRAEMAMWRDMALKSQKDAEAALDRDDEEND